MQTVTRSRSDSHRSMAVRIVADFEDSAVTWKHRALARSDRPGDRLVEHFAACYAVAGRRGFVHEVATLVGRRILGVALVYEARRPRAARHDQVLGVVSAGWRRGTPLAPLAGKQPLNRLEHVPRSRPLPGSPATAPRSRRCSSTSSSTRARRRRRRVVSISTPPTPLHGPEPPFFHAYRLLLLLPLYVFSARPPPSGKLRRRHRRLGRHLGAARMVGRIHARWPRCGCILRGDQRLRAGALDGLVRGGRGRLPVRARARPRLVERIHIELPGRARRRSQRPSHPPLADFRWTTARARTAAAGRRQGRVDPGRGPRAPDLLRRRLARARPAGARTLYERCHFARGRDGEPPPRVPARPLRRSYQRRDHAPAPAPALVRLDGLRARRRYAASLRRRRVRSRRLGGIRRNC